jgi:hypothetical protein
MPIDAFPMTRRAACGLGLAVAAGAAAPALAAVRAPCAVYDPRFAVPWGGGIALPADPTEVWLTRLRPYWRAGGGMTIGATGHDALFMLELMARDERQKLVHAARVERVPSLAALIGQAGGSRLDPLPGSDPDGLYVWVLRSERKPT